MIQRSMDATMPTLLLLEDEPLIAIDVEFNLGAAGFHVTTVSSCKEAFSWLDSNRPDIVIVDILLRDGPCHVVVERLVDQQIPFLVSSGDNPRVHADTPFAHGRWIGKPADAKEMTQAARALLAT